MNPHVPSLRHLGLVAGALAQAACLYIAPVNERPRPRVDINTPGPFHIGDRIEATANGSRDDGKLGDLRVAWQARICDREQNCDLLQVETTGQSTGQVAAVTADRKGTITFVATVTDKQGASESFEITADIVNRAPTIAQPQLNEGFFDSNANAYVIGLPVEIATSVEDSDGDPLEVSWVAFPPQGSTSTVDVVEVDGKTDTFSLDPDESGVWQVQITADDGDGGVIEHLEPVIFIPDGPPCIATTQPAANPVATVVDSATRFTVLSVSDALDPFPRAINPHPAVGQTSFSWKLATPASGGAFVDLNTAVADVLIDPTLYAPGDQLTLRVEVDDRNAHLPLGCDEAQAKCNAGDVTNPAPSCSQRTTWEIEIR